jgi:hypothetical protein
MDLLAPPRLERRLRVPTIGIRVRSPFRGMLATRDQILAELVEWVEREELTDLGHFFLRLHVVDMAGEMDIEVGATGVDHRGDDRVRPGELPAGDYATLTYRNHSLRANRALLDWVRDGGVALDRRSEADGDHFGCRTETYLTDPRTERRKTAWAVELALLTLPR